MSLADRFRGEQESGALLQLGRRVTIRIAVHVVCGLRHFPTFRARRRRCRGCRSTFRYSKLLRNVPWPFLGRLLLVSRSHTCLFRKRRTSSVAAALRALFRLLLCANEQYSRWRVCRAGPTRRERERERQQCQKGRNKRRANELSFPHAHGTPRNDRETRRARHNATRRSE